MGAAIFVLAILLIVLVAIFWNWEFIENFLPGEGGFLFDFQTQVFIIILIMVMLVFLFYTGKKRF